MRRISDADEAKILRAQIEEPPKGESQLHAFMRLLWPIVDPHPFTDGWHLHAKCEVLTAVHEGALKDVVLNEPPGSCKSMLCNVFWPAFVWLMHAPETRMLFASFDQTLVNRDTTKFVELLQHPKVKAAFPDFRLGGEHEKKAVEGFTNSHKGLRFGTTPGGKATGWHFHGHVYDDLIKPASIIDGAAMEAQKSLTKAINWVRGTAANRAIDLEKLWRVVIGQRLHEMDPPGQLLKDGWLHVCFPEEYVPNATWIMGDLSKKYDPRTREGQLLWPERRGPKAVAQIKKDMKEATTYDAQNQQNPTPASGGILRMSDFLKHGYEEIPRLILAQIVASFDLSFKESTAESSRVAWELWARVDNVDYFLDGDAEQLDYAGAKQKVKDLYKDPLWSKAQVFLIEDKANGPALISDLQKGFPKLQAFEPSGTDKLGRMLPFIVPTRVGTVRFPHPDVFPKHKSVLEELVKVPRGQHDDHWDCMSQALTYLDTGATSYSQALHSWRMKGR